jgi:PAS domain S-box-containing protein
MLLALLPMGVVMVLVVILLSSVRWLVLPELERNAQIAVQRRAEVLAGRIRAQLGTQVRELRQLARSPLLQPQPGAAAVARAELQWLLDNHIAFSWIGLADRQGLVLAGTDRWLEGQPIAAQPGLAEAWRTGQFIGDFRAAHDAQPARQGQDGAGAEVFDIVLRIDDAAGRPQALLVAHVSNRWLLGLQRYSMTGLPDGHSLRAHTLVGTPPRELSDGPPGRSDALPPLSPAWLGWVAAGGAGKPPVHAPNEALAVLWPVRNDGTDGSVAVDLPWRVLVTRDTSEALQPLGHLMRATAVLGVLAAAALGLIGFWLTRRMTQPWRVLAQAVERRAPLQSALLGAYADAVHDALQPVHPSAHEPARLPLAGLRHADSVLTRLAADARYIKRVLDHLPVGVVLSGPTLQAEYVNSTLTRQLGWTTEAVRGRLDGEFLCHDSDRAALGAQVQSLVSAPGELVARFVARQADGSSRSVQWHSVPLFNDAGRLEGTISMVIDIDAETTAQRRATVLHQRLQLLLQVAVDHALVLLDEDGRMLSWNVGAEQVFGWTHEQATGRPMDALFGPTEAESGLAHTLMAQARAQGRAPIVGRQQHASGRVLRTAGSLYAMPAQGWPAAYALLVRDATAEQEAARRLAESEARLAAVVGNASDAIISVDTQGHIELFNPAAERIFGWPVETALGQPLNLLLPDVPRNTHGGWIDVFVRSRLAIQATQDIGSGRVQGLRADGERLDLEVSISQATVGGRAVLTATLRDVTARLRSERALARYQLDLAGLAQRLLAQEKETTRRLAQTLHYELGQTLTAMRLTFDACRSVFPQQGPMAERLGRLHGLIVDGNRQVRQALVELRPPLLDDLGLVSALHNELALRGGAHPETKLRLDLASPLQERRWPADVEYAAFMVAREAVLNALQHGQAAAVVTRLEGRAGQLLLEVLDDGVGLPPGDNLRPGHLGLVGMRERALAIGAQLTVAARPERGTAVTMHWQRRVADEPALSG